MKDVYVTIPLEPQPKLRPRFRVVRGRVFTHTPYQTKAFENQVAALYLEKAKGGMFESHKPLQVKLYFGMTVPKSFSKKKRADIENDLLLHTVKPDLDNLTKSVLDALNGVAWYDDAQIVDLQVRKGYSLDGGHIEIYIKQLG